MRRKTLRFSLNLQSQLMRIEALVLSIQYVVPPHTVRISEIDVKYSQVSDDEDIEIRG